MKLWFLLAVLSTARLSDRMLARAWLWGLLWLSTKCSIVHLDDLACVVARGSQDSSLVSGFKSLKVLLQSIPEWCIMLRVFHHIWGFFSPCISWMSEIF